MTPRRLVDWRGVAIDFERAPERIVSLVPSVTDTLFALGLGDRVVGVTEYCIHPASGVRDLPKLGGTKNPDVDRIVELAPDVVFMNAEENRPVDVDRIESHARVHVSLPQTVDDCTASLLEWGELFGIESEAGALADEIREAKREASRRRAKRSAPVRVAYLVWWKPIIVAGSATYIDDLIGTAGGVNAFADRADRYPRVDPEALTRAAPEAILLSSEPYAFGEAEREVLEGLDVRSGSGKRARVRFVDGELGSWHGARTARGIRHLAAVLDEVRGYESPADVESDDAPESDAPRRAENP